MDKAEEKAGIKCSLCGAVFEPAENTGGGCPINKSCKMICCPNCGYQIPEESKLVTWFKSHGKDEGV